MTQGAPVTFACACPPATGVKPCQPQAWRRWAQVLSSEGAGSRGVGGGRGGRGYGRMPRPCARGRCRPVLEAALGLGGPFDLGGFGGRGADAFGGFTAGGSSLWPGFGGGAQLRGP